MPIVKHFKKMLHTMNKIDAWCNVSVTGKDYLKCRKQMFQTIKSEINESCLVFRLDNLERKKNQKLQCKSVIFISKRLSFINRCHLLWFDAFLISTNGTANRMLFTWSKMRWNVSLVSSLSKYEQRRNALKSNGLSNSMDITTNSFQRNRHVFTLYFCFKLYKNFNKVWTMIFDDLKASLL